MKKTTLPDFTNKLISISIVGEDYSYTLVRPRFEMQGDRLFLVGIVPRGGSSGDWSEGAVRAVAWSVVTDYLVFDSAEHYQRRLAKFKKYKKRGKK